MFEGWHVVIVILLVVPWLAALVAALGHPEDQWRRAGQNQVLFVVVIVFLGWLGALLYATIARPALKRASSTGSPVVS